MSIKCGLKRSVCFLRSPVFYLQTASQPSLVCQKLAVQATKLASITQLRLTKQQRLLNLSTPISLLRSLCTFAPQKMSRILVTKQKKKLTSLKYKVQQSGKESRL